MRVLKVKVKGGTMTMKVIGHEAENWLFSEICMKDSVLGILLRKSMTKAGSEDPKVIIGEFNREVGTKIEPDILMREKFRYFVHGQGMIDHIRIRDYAEELVTRHRSGVK